MSNLKLFWKIEGGRRKLFLRNNLNNILECNPYKSKLAASIFNGLEIFPFSDNEKILIIGENIENETKEIFKTIFSNKSIYENYFDSNLIELENISILYVNVTSVKEWHILKDDFFMNLPSRVFIFFMINKNVYKEIKNILKMNLKGKLDLIQEINLGNFFYEEFLLVYLRR